MRFVGVTGHADPDVMRKSITRWPFDAILFPLNCVDPHHLSFEQDTLPAAVEQGLARVAMKVFASGNLVKQGSRSRALPPLRVRVWTSPPSSSAAGP